MQAMDAEGDTALHVAIRSAARTDTEALAAAAAVARAHEKRTKLEIEAGKRDK